MVGGLGDLTGVNCRGGECELRRGAVGGELDRGGFVLGLGELVDEVLPLGEFFSGSVRGFFEWVVFASEGFDDDGVVGRGLDSATLKENGSKDETNFFLCFLDGRRR